MHVMRVHYQAMVWNQLSDSGIKPADWGWECERNKLVPIKISGDIAPDHMLTVVHCNCKSNCSSFICLCRKHGLKCVSACGNCHGSECTNVREVIIDSDIHETDVESHTPCTFSENLDLPDFLWEDDVNVQYEHEEEV